jgi:hypothetical protein
MRRTITVSLLLLAVSAHADGPTAIHGTNDLGEEFVLNEQYFDFGPNNSPRYPLFYWEIHVKKGANEQVFEKDFCGIPDFHGPGLHFKCESDAKSPLAGATYIKIKELTKCRGTLYVCKTGCGPRAPRELIKDAWECGMEFIDLVDQYVVACKLNNTKTKGIIYGQGINLREKPDLTSQALARLSDKTKVEILERIKECISIDGEKGEWVRVRVVVDKVATEGWVFDAYIEYVDKYPSYLL